MPIDAVGKDNNYFVGRITHSFYLWDYFNLIVDDVDQQNSPNNLGDTDRRQSEYFVEQLICYLPVSVK